MKRTCLVLCCLLSSVSVLAQTPPQIAVAPRPAQERCTISGTVVRLATSEPLKSAYIRLALQGERGGAPLGATTDASGKFALTNIEPGRYRLTVARNGYVTQEYGQRSPSAPGAILALSSGQKIQDLLFRLVPAAVISGRIQDEDGEPLPWVQVLALREAYLNGKRELASEATVSTNDLGEYRLFNLRPGRYFVRASYQPGVSMTGYMQFMSVPAESSGGYAPTYYPGTNDPANARTITVKAGEEARSVDFILRQVPVFEVRGRVFNAVTGRPGEDVSLELVPRVRRLTWKFSNVATSVDKQGSFEIRGVVSGSYNLIASWSDEGKSYMARQPVEVVATDVEGLQVTITPGVAVNGHVSWDGKPSLSERELHIYLISTEDGYFGEQANVQADGSFTYKNIPEGTYRIYSWGGAEDCFLKSARYGSTDALSGGFALRRASDATLEVTLSSRGARVDGVVKNSDELPAPGVWVALVPDQARRVQERLDKSATTDQYGRFVLRGIAPGEYKLFSWDEVERGAWQDPDFLQPFEDKGQKVRLELGGREVVELKLIETKKEQKP
jgi:hypothetical protein